jgi:hypothetical protein
MDTSIATVAGNSGNDTLNVAPKRLKGSNSRFAREYLFQIDECRMAIDDFRSCRWIEPDSSLRQSTLFNRHSSILGAIFVAVFTSQLVTRNDLFIPGQTLADSTSGSFIVQTTGLTLSIQCHL